VRKPEEGGKKNYGTVKKKKKMKEGLSTVCNGGLRSQAGRENGKNDKDPSSLGKNSSKLGEAQGKNRTDSRYNPKGAEPPKKGPEPNFVRWGDSCRS